MIEVNVNVNVSLSDDAKSFIQTLFANRPMATTVSNEKVTKSEAPKSTAKVSEPAEVKETMAPKPTAKADAPKPTAKADAPEVSIEDVRAALSAKVADHRDEIKAKLTDLGAPSVTKLSPDKYVEMINFLEGLE